MGRALTARGALRRHAQFAREARVAEQAEERGVERIKRRIAERFQRENKRSISMLHSNSKAMLCARH